jgi:hypothetical protein
LVTGLGTSRASFLIPSLVSFSGTSNTRIAYAKVTPPAGLKFNKMFDTGSDSAGSSAGNSTSLVASGSTSAVRNLSLWAVGRGRRSDLLPSA